MRVIGIAGQKQNGKDTLGDHLIVRLNENGESWKKSALAKPVKQIFADTFDVTLDFIEEWKVKSEIPPGFNATVREGLQMIGDGYRKLKKDIWIDIAYRDKTRDLVFSDVRYINELLKNRQEGGINILVVHPDRVNYDENESESQMRSFALLALQIWKDKNFVDISKFDFELIQICTNEESFKMHAKEKMSIFDFCIFNKGTVQDFYNLIDENLVQLCQDFKFKESK